MLELPFPPRRSHLIAFWWTLTLFMGLVLLFAAQLMASPMGTIGVGGAALVVLLVSGLIWKQIPAFVYRVWFSANKRFARVAQVYVASLIHFVVFTTAKSADSALQLSEVKGSMWRTYPARSTKPGGAARSRHSWVAEFLQNAKTPERRWWLFLLPLLLVLALFRSGKESSEMPENIYTLF